MPVKRVIAHFPTQFSSHGRVHARPGSRIKPVYQARKSDSGSIELVQTGEENIYDAIQAEREGCELTSILRRFANGETDVLSRTQGMYGDFTNFPTTYAEMLNKLIEGRAVFEGLPLEERQKYGNDFGVWLQSFDDVSRETSDDAPVKQLDPISMEVKTDES